MSIFNGWEIFKIGYFLKIWNNPEEFIKNALFKDPIKCQQTMIFLPNSRTFQESVSCSSILLEGQNKNLPIHYQYKSII